MTTQRPELDGRHETAILADLRRQANAVPPLTARSDRDWLQALLEIAARISSEVTRRLDLVPEKNRRNFLDWLGVTGRGARAARLAAALHRPAPGEALVVEKRLRLQAQTKDGTVAFETEQDVRVLGGELKSLYAVDGGRDRIYAPPPGLLDPISPKPSPIARQLKEVAAAKSTQVQITPTLDLAPSDVLAIEDRQYRIVELKDDVVTIEPQLLQRTDRVAATHVRTFAPFAEPRPAPRPDDPCRSESYEPDDAAQTSIPHDWQEHVLYIGDDDLLNIEGSADITIESSPSLMGLAWCYFGKRDPEATGASEEAAKDEPQWQSLALEQRTVELKDGTKTQVPVLAKSKKGAIEQVELNGKKVRALRARGTASQLVKTVRLKVKSPSSSSSSERSARTAIPFEAVANVTPITSPENFHPLGKTPQLFDSFYLGCAEAFSKGRAKVALSFDFAIASLGPLACVLKADKALVFSVGDDGLPYLLSANRRPADGQAIIDSHRSLTPPARSIDDFGEPVSLLLNRGQQLGTSLRNATITIAGAVGRQIWALDVPDSSTKDGSATEIWRSLGELQRSEGEAETSNQELARTSVILLEEAESWWAVALCQGKFFENTSAGSAPPDWRERKLPDEEVIHHITGVYDAATPETRCRRAHGVVAVDSDGKIFRWLAGSWTRLGNNVEIDPAVPPLALRLADDSTIVVGYPKKEGPRDKIVVVSQHGTKSLDVPEGLEAKSRFGFVLKEGEAEPRITFLAGQGVSSQLKLVGLRSSHTTKPTLAELGVARRFTDDKDVVGAPLTVASDKTAVFLVAGADAELFSFAIDDDGDIPVSIPGELLSEWFVGDVPDAAFVDVNGQVWKIAGRVALTGNRTAFGLEGGPPTLPNEVDGEFYRAIGKPVDSGWESARRLKRGDGDVEVGAVLLVGDRLFKITSLTPTTITVDKTLPTVISVYLRVQFDAEHPLVAHPALRIGGWAHESLVEAGTEIAFKDAEPRTQTCVAVGAGYAILSEPWTTRPAGNQDVKIKTSGLKHDSWTAFKGETNPNLSWEYWNGAAWWHLECSDGTDNLRGNGSVKFTVPTDLQPIEVAGRSNHWIRARLVGGDYGRETFETHTRDEKDPAGKVTQIQTTVRKTDTVHPPWVLSLRIDSETEPGIPKYIVTHDNLAWRDQSDANRSASASLDIFQPFREAVAGHNSSRRNLQGDCLPTSASAQTNEGAVLDVLFKSLGVIFRVVAGSIVVAAATNAINALYLGASAELDGTGVRIFWDVEERDDKIDLAIEVRHKDEFAPVLCEDDTRGLCESGLMTLTFATASTPSTLFGQSLHWLRIRPKDSKVAASWRPVVKGVYLNAVWAVALETQDAEILGSSDGAPNQRVTVTRPPILSEQKGGGLELRVREALSEEEAAALNSGCLGTVVKDPEGMPKGFWVQWRHVVDPLDRGPDERVFALDDESGEVRFGDAEHGRIPPPGVDNIAAFTYRRGGGNAGNGINAGAVLQAGSALDGVDTIVAVAASAGGADPATTEETLKGAPAGLWRRDRALTERDIETLALAYAPDIAQAKCVAAPVGRHGTNLVVVVSSKNHRQPTVALRRELRRYILERGGASINRERSFDVVAPVLRPCRIRLTAVVEDLDNTATTERSIKERLEALLDPVTGGVECFTNFVDGAAADVARDPTKSSNKSGGGWPLGRVPTESEIAVAVADVASLSGVATIVLLAGQKGDDRFPERIPGWHLVVLMRDGVEVEWRKETI